MSEIDEIAKKCVGKKLPICLYQLCVQNCEFLKQYCETPGELAEKIRQGGFEDKPELAYSCNLCGLCEKLCVRGLDIGHSFLEYRQERMREGTGPLPKHQPVIADQEFVNSDSFFLVLPNPANGETRRFFFPGCNLSAYSPELVQKTYEYLRGKLPGTGIVLGCCGGPVHSIGDQEGFLNTNNRVVSQMKAHGASELIAACPHCYHLFDDYAEGIQVTSLYEIMANMGLPSDAKLSADKVFSLHDSCNTREVGKIQDAVRQVLKELGCSIEEPEFTREMTRCCGMGGMAAYVDLRLVNKTIMRRAREMPHDIISYCASCRDAFAMVGKPSRHILDLIFNPEWESAAKAPFKQGPARRQNQARLRDLLSAEYGDS